MVRSCSQCTCLLKEKFKIKFCSNRCQSDYYYDMFLEKWKKGIVSGGIGITTRTISAYVRRFLLKKYGERCSLCGWGERHPITDKVPLEIDHIDGNSENNS